MGVKINVTEHRKQFITKDGRVIEGSKEVGPVNMGEAGVNPGTTEKNRDGKEEEVVE